jgi:malonyl-CoA O-methyltransferase
LRAELALPEPRAARRAFARAAPGFAAASAVHDEIRGRLLERLDWLAAVPAVVVDVGCGVARGAHALARRFPQARVLALDSSPAMLAAARRSLPPDSAIGLVAGDAARLPLRAASVDLLLASMVLPWSRPDVLFAEAARALADGGVVLFSTLGPDSLVELRRAWAAVDDRIHVHAAFDMHDLGDLALAAGLGDAVLDVDRITVEYADLAAAVAELRACGAVNVAAGRRPTLTGSRRWRGFAAQLVADQPTARLDLTLEVVLGQAFSRGPRARRPAAADEVGVPIERIGRGGRPA